MEDSSSDSPAVTLDSIGVEGHSPASATDQDGSPVPPNEAETNGPPDNRRESLLDRVTLAVNSSLDILEVLDRLASLALEACPAHRCSIFLLDESGTKLVPRIYVAHPEVAEEIAQADYDHRPHFRDLAPIDLEADASRSRAFLRGKAFTIPDLSTSALVPQEVVTQFRARSAIVVPLIAPNEPLGVLALDWMKPKDEFPQTQIVLAEAIAAYASLAIRNARLFERLNDKARSLERLVGVASALNSSLSLSEVFDLAFEGFAELLGSDSCSINLLDDAPDATRSGNNTDALLEGPRRLTSDEASRLKNVWAGRTQPTIHEKTGDRDLDVVFSLCPTSATSVAVFPLLRAETVRGFVLAPVAVLVPPSAEQIELGRALAGLVATAMERAELYESLKSQLQQIEVLYGLSDAIAGTSDLAAALRQLNQLLGGEIGIELESISVANDRLRNVLDAQPPTGVEMEAIRSWRATLGRSRARLRPRELGDAVLVPIASRGRVQGVLRVRPGDRSLDPPGEELLLAIGTACAEVIHKAGLRRDLAESEHRLAIAAERERIAQDLHDSVGQLITGLGMRLTSYALEAPDDEWRSRLEELVDVTAQGSRQIREAIHSLLFFQVRRRGLVPSLRELAQTFEATSGVETILQVRGRVVAVEPAKEDGLFRVAHEALTNVQRHSGSPSVAMTLAYEPGEVVLAIRDQGSGFGRRDPFRDQPGHFGLRGIRRRLEEAGGELLVANAHPRGVLIEARVRLRRRRAHATGASRRH